MNGLRPLKTIAVALALTLTAACGGDDDDDAGDVDTSTTVEATTTTVETTTTTTTPTTAAAEGLCDVAGRYRQEFSVNLFERPPDEVEAFFADILDVFEAGLDVVPADLADELAEVLRKYTDLDRKLAEYGYDIDAVLAALQAQSDNDLAVAVDEVGQLTYDPAAASLRDLVADQCGIIIDPFQL